MGYFVLSPNKVPINDQNVKSNLHHPVVAVALQHKKIRRYTCDLCVNRSGFNRSPNQSAVLSMCFWYSTKDSLGVRFS